MPFATATQPQLEELQASLRTLAQRLQRVAQGSFPAPLTPESRVSLVNLSTRLATILEVLEVITPGGPALGPNDIIIDSTVPVPVRDQDTGVTGTAHVTLEPDARGVPLIGFTGEEVSLVKAGTTVMLGRPAGLPAAPAVLASGNPLTTTSDVNDRTLVGRVGDAAMILNTLGTPHAATLVGYDAQGKVKVQLSSAAYAGVIANAETAGLRSYYEIGTKPGATGRIQINDQKLNFFSTGPLCYPLVHNELITDPVSLTKYRFLIDKGRILSITPE